MKPHFFYKNGAFKPYRFWATWFLGLVSVAFILKFFNCPGVTDVTLATVVGFATSLLGIYTWRSNTKTKNGGQHGKD